MAVTDPDTRRKLADRMNRERVQRRLGTWDHIAREMGISSALLRGIRNGSAPITYESEVAIEQLYGWPEGTVRELLPLPSEVPARREWSAEQRARWKTMSGVEIVDEARRIEKTDGRDARIEYLEAALAAQDERRAATEDSRR